jgi:threonine/homoserine/homoserine lactone efflux protein
MPDPLTSALAGVVFGLALAAPPGPMNAVIAEESVVRGWLSGFTAGLGAMTADAVFCALTLLGVVGIVERAPAVRGVMVGIGGLLMLYFAYGAAVDAREADGFLQAAADAAREGASHDDGTWRGDHAPDGGASHDGGAALHSDGDATSHGDGPVRGESRGFRKAFALALTNPYQILFWLSAGVGMLKVGTLDVLGQTPYVGDQLAGVLVVRTGSPALLVGFFGGIGLWVVGYPGTLVAVGKRVDRFAAAVAWGSAAVLAGFGVVFLVDAAGALLSLAAS